MDSARLVFDLALFAGYAAFGVIAIPVGRENSPPLISVVVSSTTRPREYSVVKVHNHHEDLASSSYDRPSLSSILGDDAI